MCWCAVKKLLTHSLLFPLPRNATRGGNGNGHHWINCVFLPLEGLRNGSPPVRSSGKVLISICVYENITLLYIRPGFYLDGWSSADRWTIWICNQPPRSTQPSIAPGRLIEYQPVWLGLGGEFTCVGWQVTLWDLIWQMMPRSSEMTCSGELYRLTCNLISFNL